MLPGSANASSVTALNQVPLIEFGDFDRDAMIDMVYYLDGSIYTFYNMYQANEPTATSLCKGATDGAHLRASPIFSSFHNIANNDTEVGSHHFIIFLLTIFIIL